MGLILYLTLQTFWNAAQVKAWIEGVLVNSQHLILKIYE